MSEPNEWIRQHTTLTNNSSSNIIPHCTEYQSDNKFRLQEWEYNVPSYENDAETII